MKTDEVVFAEGLEHDLAHRSAEYLVVWSNKTNGIVLHALPGVLTTTPSCLSDFTSFYCHPHSLLPKHPGPLPML